MLTRIVGLLLLTMLIRGTSQAEEIRPFMATGFKVCEVTSDRAIIWTRLTREASRVNGSHPQPDIFYIHPETGGLVPRGRGRRSMTPVVQWPKGYDINTINGAVPGLYGEVRLSYRRSDSEGVWTQTNWVEVDSDRDFTRQISLTGLDSGTGYELRVESRRNGIQGQMREGSFKTAPMADVPAKIVFAVITGQGNNGQESERGFRIYPQMKKLNLDFFVNTGDILYYDSRAKTLPLARWHWQRLFSFRHHVDFHEDIPSYFMKDDHDTWMNDCYPCQETKFMGEFTFEQGQDVFLEQVGMGDRTWRTVRWGKDLQVWMVEGRDYRSKHTNPDGPEKTIWGKEQKQWLFETMQKSEATFRVLISPTPIVGPDRDRKNDNHANAGFATEGNEVRRFLATQKNTVVICGDRHWQYVSVDDETGVREYSTGPASDGHAGGWRQDDLRPEHQYLNVVGGFMAGTVERVDQKPTLTFTHYSVDGKVLNEDAMQAVE
jgi:alkaline phosphatase D